MKSIVQNINKTLLEKLPLIWNTRLLWMVLITALVHLIFFILGINVFRKPELLQEYFAYEIYAHNGTLLFSIVCSVLIIVVWLILLFRHNSFKNYYPTSRWQLFGSFAIYFILFFLSTTFYTSYALGYTLYLNKKYPDAKLTEQINTANLAAAFLSVNPADYTIDNRKYPSPFDSLYCETKEEQIDFNKPYLQRFNDEYQFYTVVKKLVPASNYKNLGNAYINSIYQENISDSLVMFAYRGEVVDVSSIANTEVSYYNYSRILFDQHLGGEVYFSRGRSYREGYHGKDSGGISLNKEVYELLKRNDASELKRLLTSFLNAAAELNIRTNLSVDNWLSLINRDSFTVEKFIENSKMQIDEQGNPETEGLTEMVADDAIAGLPMDTIRNTPENRSKQQQFYRDRKTGFYFDADGLDTAFGNIVSIKLHNYRDFLFHFQCWLAFGLSILLFIFRTSGLSPLLFSIITAIVISILITLLTMSLSINDALSIFYIVFTAGTAILLMPLLFLKQVKKQVQAVFINITLAGIVPYILLILLIINQHQENYYQKILGDLYYKKKPDFIFDILGENLSCLLLAAGFIFVLLYTTIIKRWKALPER
ncbi:MAG: hypothetical protein KF746_09765 [Chitinophagaceae bacterium]|nr:hypothetical protein [Chitinophagaceae bacterium]